jgi:DNA repair and recombination protein RAD52
MSFTDEQKKSLAAPLSSQNVKGRKQGGREVHYVEGWHAIAEANRIFGFDSWTRETTEIKCVSERERKIGKEPNTPTAGASRTSRRSASWSLPMIPW